MTLFLRVPIVSLVLAASAVGQTIPPMPTVSVPVLESVVMTGGSQDDQDYAQAALALKAGDPVGEDVFFAGLAAIRATDRFSRVEGRLENSPKGRIAVIELVPWPAIQSREWQGDCPKSLRNNLFTGMHKGGRAGDLRLARWQIEAEQRLAEAGYTAAHVKIAREDGGARLVIQADAGPPQLVRTVTVAGEFFPYRPERLQSIAGIVPGKTIWNATVQREAALKLRQRLVKDERFEGNASFSWDPAAGRLTLHMEAGPVVHLRKIGDWSIWWKNFKDLLPLARAASYSPELLDEGDRRILRYLRDKGYLDAKISHSREILKGSIEKPEIVVVTFSIQTGSKTRISNVRFEHTKDLSEEELRAAAALPSGLWTLGKPPITPDLLNAIEDRVKALYWRQGYPDMTLRRSAIDHHDGKSDLVFDVHEGSQQTIEKIILEVPSDPSWFPWILADSLPQVISRNPAIVSLPDANTLLYQTDRKAVDGWVARLEQSQDPARPEIRLFTLTTNKPLLFVKSDLAAVLTTLRQRMSSMGVQRPSPRLNLERGITGYIVRIAVPDQPRLKVNRFVVQGADKTKARAVLRETQLIPGMPLDPDRLSKAQTNLGNIDAFQRVDLDSLNSIPEEEGPLPWKEGDLLLRTDERIPWVLGNSFGYDKSQGYHIGATAERLNFMGMGRTLDFGIRAGDTTIQNPTLRKWFPTGEFNRSVDSYSVGYTDPWFLPGALKDLIKNRVRYHAEAAYIEETQAAFLARRRRLTNSFEWKLGDNQSVLLGHRFERTDIKPNLEGISLDELFAMAGVPGPQTVISAPFLQVTVDRRDRPLDPRSGTFFSGRLELANQLFGTGAKYSFAKLDLRKQWNWSVGDQAQNGVVMAAARIGVARPTASSVDNLPLAERFFAGGPFTVRGVEPDLLGPVGTLGLYDIVNGVAVRKGSKMIPLGGQGLVVFNLEYRFPFFGSQTVWGEVFADSGQVYAKLNPGHRQPGDPAPFPPLRTTLGMGLILKLGLPIKFEYAADLKRILGKPRTQQEVDTQLKGILVSAGFQY